VKTKYTESSGPCKVIITRSRERGLGVQESYRGSIMAYESAHMKGFRTTKRLSTKAYKTINNFNEAFEKRHDVEVANLCKGF